MSNAYLSSRHGKIESIKLFRYVFVDWVINDIAAREKLVFWLKSKSSFLIYDIEDTCFFTFNEIDKSLSTQFHLNGVKSLTAPFLNTQYLSDFISSAIKTELLKKYKQYLNTNIFYEDEKHYSPFKVLKAFEYNVVFFQSGEYLIHFMPISKIVGAKEPIDLGYIASIKNAMDNSLQVDSMPFTLANITKQYKLKYDLIDSEVIAKIENELKSKEEYCATFDYHFLASYSPELYVSITKDLTKNLSQSLKFISSVLQQLNLQPIFNLSKKVFFRIDLKRDDLINNLLVGKKDVVPITIHYKVENEYGLRIDYTIDNDTTKEKRSSILPSEELKNKLNKLACPFATLAVIEKRETWKKEHVTDLCFTDADLHFKTAKQSTSYYKGIYKPVDNWTILPVVYGGLNINNFIGLISKFNHGGNNLKLLDPIVFGTNESANNEIIDSIIKRERTKILMPIFSKYNLPNDILPSNKRIKKQIFKGDMNNSKEELSKLSNFTCRCLEKMGGLVAAISETYLENDGYFIGIDLGHTTFDGNKYSNLAITIFDAHGIYIGSALIEKLPRKENLSAETCKGAFEQLNKILNKSNLQKPKSVVIHRDGKLHSEDISNLNAALNLVWGNIPVDIVEIIKSGFPIIAIKNNEGVALNPESGDRYIDEVNKYSILVTNTQATQKDALINPIIVKHQFGSMDFKNIVSQVYWLTKVYTNNLYNSTRLPATTLKANNIVSTSAKIHKPTFLG